jgi:hypothetical protein
MPTSTETIAYKDYDLTVQQHESRWTVLIQPRRPSSVVVDQGLGPTREAAISEAMAIVDRLPRSVDN